MSNQIYIYLISRIHEDAHVRNMQLVGCLANKENSLSDVDVFVPHLNNPCDVTHASMPLDVFQMDLDAMVRADAACVAFPVGKDCCAEIGWFHGSGKPVVGIFMPSEEPCYDSLKADWMVKGFLTHMIVVGSPTTYAMCCADAILKDKTSFAQNASDVSDQLARIMRMRQKSSCK